MADGQQSQSTRCDGCGRTSLGAQSLGEDSVGKTGHVVLALLDDDAGEDTDVVGDDATTDGLKVSAALNAKFDHNSPSPQISTIVAFDAQIAVWLQKYALVSHLLNPPSAPIKKNPPSSSSHQSDGRGSTSGRQRGGDEFGWGGAHPASSGNPACLYHQPLLVFTAKELDAPLPPVMRRT